MKNLIKSLLISTCLLAFTFLLASAALVTEANASAKDQVLVRYISATWCGPCHVLKADLLAKGILPADQKGKAISNGSFETSVNDQAVRVTLQDLDYDMLTDTDKNSLTPSLDMETIQGVPTMQIYIGGKKVYEGYDSFALESLGLDYDTISAASGRSGVTVRVVQEFLKSIK